MARLHLDDPMAYKNFIRMPPELYQELEQRITAEFQRDRTLMRDPVSPGVKLAVTLRHLATGDWWTKGELFHPLGQRLPPQALANEAQLKPHYGIEGEGLQL